MLNEIRRMKNVKAAIRIFKIKEGYATKNRMSAADVIITKASPSYNWYFLGDVGCSFFHVAFSMPILLA